MISYLKKIGFNDKEIKYINTNIPSSILALVEKNQDEGLKIINYLSQIGVNNCQGIFMENVDLFTKTFDQVRLLFKNCSNKEIVKDINEDVSAIYELYE